MYGKPAPDPINNPCPVCGAKPGTSCVVVDNDNDDYMADRSSPWSHGLRFMFGQRVRMVLTYRVNANGDRIPGVEVGDTVYLLGSPGMETRMKPFVRWLWKQKDRDDPVGDLVKDAMQDRAFPVEGSVWVIRRYLARYPQAAIALETARADYRLHRRGEHGRAET